jgi:hypothetical protein
MKKITVAELEKWDAMPDRQKITILRREAERLRALEPQPHEQAFMTAEEWADVFDEEADQIETGEEEETPEQLAAEAKASQQIADLLKRHDAGSLNTLFKR